MLKASSIFHHDMGQSLCVHKTLVSGYVQSRVRLELRGSTWTWRALKISWRTSPTATTVTAQKPKKTTPDRRETCSWRSDA